MSATRSSPGCGGGGLQVYPAGLGPQTATPLLALQGQRGRVDSWLDMKMYLSGVAAQEGDTHPLHSLLLPLASVCPPRSGICPPLQRVDSSPGQPSMLASHWAQWEAPAGI